MLFSKSVTGPTHEEGRKRMYGCSSEQWYSFSEETSYLIFHLKNPKQIEQVCSPVKCHPLYGSWIRLYLFSASWVNETSNDLLSLVSTSTPGTVPAPVKDIWCQPRFGNLRNLFLALRRAQKLTSSSSHPVWLLIPSVHWLLTFSGLMPPGAWPFFPVPFSLPSKSHNTYQRHS